MKLYDIIKKEELGDSTLSKRFKKSTQTSEVEVNEYQNSDYNDQKKGSSIKKIFIIFSGIAFVILIYILGIKLVHAKVTITPREVPFSIDKMKIEVLNEKTANKDEVSFQTMVINSEVSREVFGGDLKTSTVKAQGKAVFINDFSKSAQTIKAKTTLIGSNKKKYQTDQSVTISGYTTKDDKKVSGTSVQVGITAVEAGPMSDSPGLSFTISGYTTAKSKQLYAQSAGAVSGGEAGSVYAVSDKEKPDVLATLSSQLTERLKRETRTQIPVGFVAFPDLQFVTIDTDAVKLRGSGIKFPVTVKGTMVSYLIPRNLLEVNIASKVMSDHNFGGVTIPNIMSLIVEPMTVISTNPKNIPESITISITGSGKIITKVPTEKIKDVLIGINKKNFSNNLANIYEINTAKYNMYPFWSPFFPHDLNKIDVITK